jgi:hypothetical protein
MNLIFPISGMELQRAEEHMIELLLDDRQTVRTPFYVTTVWPWSEKVADESREDVGPRSDAMTAWARENAAILNRVEASLAESFLNLYERIIEEFRHRT